MNKCVLTFKLRELKNVKLLGFIYLTFCSFRIHFQSFVIASIARCFYPYLIYIEDVTRNNILQLCFQEHCQSIFLFQLKISAIIPQQS